MRTATLLPDADAVRLETLVADGDAITVVVTTRGDTARCPDCGAESAHLHSRKRRRLTDLPWQGLAVRLDLQLRRFYCRTPTCARRTFTERVPTVVAPYARRTRRLATVVEAIAFALGGEPGARLLAALGLALSPDTLLRAIEAAPLPATPTPRVLGVDDWARRRGQTYGTILVDLERRRPVDVLPDRSAATFAAWLAAHPGVEVISRDRGGAYAEGGRQGAPDAVQVADRFHLAKNVDDALERVLQRHRAALRRAAAAAQPAAAAGAPTDPPPPALRPALPAPPATPYRRQRQLLYEEMVRLAAAGWSQAAIARQVGLHPVTVRAYLLAGGPPDLTARGPKPGACRGDHEAYLRERWRAGCHDGKALWGELREQGYRSSLRTVQRLVAGWRAPDEPRRGKRPAGLPAAPLPPPRPPSPRRVRWWLLLPAEERSAAQADFLAALLARCPEVAAAEALARDFLGLLRARDGSALDGWFGRAADSEVAEFRELAGGLAQDRPAVEAALTSPWSNGQVEGHVNKLKLVKRAMFGRAGFPLLRRRVLGAA
jgi:transposase